MANAAEIVADLQAEFQAQAETLQQQLSQIIEFEDLKKYDLSSLRNLSVGGGALPLLELPSRCLGVRIEGLSANKLEIEMRGNSPPIIGRIEDDRFVMDPRTLLEEDLPIIQTAFERLLK